jgi:uncharacterized membrane protein
MRDHSRIFSFITVAAAFAVSVIAFPHLPPRIPTHWNFSGHADGFSGRVAGAFVLPSIMLGVWIILSLIPRFDRALFIRYENRKSDNSTVAPVYGILVGVTLAMFLAIHLFAIFSALGAIGANMQPLIIAVIASIGAIAIGNYMPRVTRRNAFIGFRVPWAYASEEVWRRTQRAGGYGMVAAGVIGLLGAFVLPSAPFGAFLVAMIAQIVIVMIYSYRIAHSGDVD